MAFEKSRARDEILFYIFQFCLAHRYGDKIVGHLHGFNSTYGDEKEARPGDLILLTSIRHKRWSLAWLLEIDKRQYGNRYLCESIETGELCWWENVGVEYLDRDVVESSENWKWTDRQFQFEDRWNRVCYKQHDAYITLPLPPRFGDGHQVTLGTRTRYGLDDKRPEKTFDDWRKVTKKMMSEFYLECAASRAAA